LISWRATRRAELREMGDFFDDRQGARRHADEPALAAGPHPDEPPTEFRSALLQQVAASSISRCTCAGSGLPSRRLLPGGNFKCR